MEAARARSHFLNGTGLIGPGDPLFNPLAIHHPQNDRRAAGLGTMPSVFDEEDEKEDEDEYGGESRRRHQNATALEDLPPDADSASVVLAWAQRLKKVYSSCAQGANDYDEEELSQLKLEEDAPNVKLTRVPRPPVPPSTSAVPPQNEDFQSTQPNNLASPGPGIGRPPNMNQLNASRGRTTGNVNTIATKSPGHDSGDIHVKLIKGVKTIDWELELSDFYDAVGAPQKIPGIPAILKAWEGKEERMIQNLMKKYEGKIPKKTLVHLERIYGFLETQTEVSQQPSPVRAGRR
jgi:hypothetical protein